MTLVARPVADLNTDFLLAYLVMYPSLQNRPGLAETVGTVVDYYGHSYVSDRFGPNVKKKITEELNDLLSDWCRLGIIQDFHVRCDSINNLPEASGITVDLLFKFWWLPLPIHHRWQTKTTEELTQLQNSWAKGDPIHITQEDGKFSYIVETLVRSG